MRALLAVGLLVVACSSSAATPRGPTFDPSLAEACARHVACRSDAGLMTVSSCVFYNRLDPTMIDRGRSGRPPDYIPVSCINAARADCTAEKACIPADVACDPNTRPTCEGQTVVSCLSGFVAHETCADDARCENGLCVGNGAACTEAACDGTNVLACTGGHQARKDCSIGPVPTACGDQCALLSIFTLGICPAKSFVCIPGPTTECDPRSHQDTCEGSRLVFCDGHERDIDCTSLGFSGCSAGRCQ